MDLTGDQAGNILELLLQIKTFCMKTLKVIFGTAAIAAVMTACNNAAEKEEKINEDSINQSTLGDKDPNDRGVTVYDSTQPHTQDTASYERMNTKTDSIPHP